jgi:hypothetical protein
LKSDIKDHLKEEITQDEKTELLHEIQEIQQALLDIKAQQKGLETDVKNKRGQYFSVKNAFKELRMRKTKAD